VVSLRSLSPEYVELNFLKDTIIFTDRLPNGLRYPLVGGMRERYFDGINLKPHNLLENARTPTSRVHAVLGAFRGYGHRPVVQPSKFER
jgi:hypothetical protein